MSWASRLKGLARKDFAPGARKGAGWPPSWAGIIQAGTADAPAGYEAQARAAMRNAVALRCLRMVTEGLASVHVNAAGASHPALPLISAALLETVASQLLLQGNAYLETGLDAGGLPIALWPLRPERVTLETDANGWPAAYAYRVGARVQRFRAEGDAGAPALLHLKAPGPLDDHLGVGVLEAASEPVALLNAAARWNRGLLANAARPSGALVLDADEGPLTAEQFQRLRDEIEAGFQGAHNAGRPMLLEGGLRWQALALTPAEMDFQKAREAAARDVALAFGVPPMLLGLPGDSTHANYAEANVALWRLSILPLLSRILAGLSTHLGQWWPGLQLEPDLDQVPALWADRERLWRHVGEAAFLSDDEKREMLGWGARGSGQ